MPQPAPYSFNRTYAQKTSNGDAPTDPRRRPTTAALPRYMQETAVSRQRTLFYGLIEVDPRTPSNGAAGSPARRRASENAAAKQSSPRNRPFLIGRPVTGVESSGGVSLPQRDCIDRPPTDGGGEAPKDATDDGAGKDRSDPRIVVVEEVTVSLPLPPSDPRRPAPGSSSALLSTVAAAGRCSPPDSAAAVCRLPDIIISNSTASEQRRVTSTDADRQPPVHGEGGPQERHTIAPRRRESGTDRSTSSPVDRREARTGSSSQQDHHLAAAVTITDLQIGGPRTPVGVRTRSLKWSVPSEASPSSGSSQNIRLYRRRSSKMTSCASNDNNNNNNNDNIIEGTISDGSVVNRTNGNAFYGTSTGPFERQYNGDVHLESTNETYSKDCVTTSNARNNDDDDDSDSEIFDLPNQKNKAEDDLVFLHSNGDVRTLGMKTRCQTAHERSTRNGPSPRPYNLQRPVEKRISCADDDDFSVPLSRYPPLGHSNNFVSAAPLSKGLIRASKSQPNLAARVPHGRLDRRRRQNESRNSVAATRQKPPRRSVDRTKNYDDDDSLDDYDDELVKTKKERVAQWLIGAIDIAEPPTCPPEIEDDSPPQRDNAIHIVYDGD